MDQISFNNRPPATSGFSFPVKPVSQPTGEKVEVKTPAKTSVEDTISTSDAGSNVGGLVRIAIFSVNGKVFSKRNVDGVVIIEPKPLSPGEVAVVKFSTLA